MHPTRVRPPTSPPPTPHPPHSLLFRNLPVATIHVLPRPVRIHPTPPALPIPDCESGYAGYKQSGIDEDGRAIAVEDFDFLARFGAMLFVDGHRLAGDDGDFTPEVDLDFAVP